MLFTDEQVIQVPSPVRSGSLHVPGRLPHHILCGPSPSRDAAAGECPALGFSPNIASGKLCPRRYLCRFLSRLSVSVISARPRQNAAQEDWMCAETAEESVS